MLGEGQVMPGQVDVIVGDDPALQLRQVGLAVRAFKFGVEGEGEARFGVAVDPRRAIIGGGAKR